MNFQEQQGTNTLLIHKSPKLQRAWCCQPRARVQSLDNWLNRIQNVKLWERESPSSSRSGCYQLTGLHRCTVCKSGLGEVSQHNTTKQNKTKDVNSERGVMGVSVFTSEQPPLQIKIHRRWLGQKCSQNNRRISELIVLVLSHLLNLWLTPGSYG